MPLPFALMKATVNLSFLLGSPALVFQPPSRDKGMMYRKEQRCIMEIISPKVGAEDLLASESAQK